MNSNAIKRAKIIIQGAVQGVGFRPFIFRLATDLALYGFVKNSTAGVHIEVEGNESLLHEFIQRIGTEKPTNAFIYSQETTYLDPVGFIFFKILSSENHQNKTAWILPDIATCPDCIKDIFDPTNRRYLYPFTNCTNCGPRFSIIKSLPYDRKNTSMDSFVMCEKCEEEYHNPADRRFHAQPNACPVCGPIVELQNHNGDILFTKKEAITQTIDYLNKGKIIALKGIGGFLLLVDAENEKAVNTLRLRKQREEKPFAVLFPSIHIVKNYCLISYAEKRWLQSPEAPIVLLERLGQTPIAESVAPNNPNLGVVLPYSPLLHIITHFFKRPLVATSGNLSNAPIAINNEEALTRLGTIADCFLMNNRPIVRPVDDSIGRIMAGREMVVRRARGFAPLPITIKKDLHPIMAVGGQLKNTVAIGQNKNVFISQHIGDLETPESLKTFKNACVDLPNLYDLNPQAVYHDLHPEYCSTTFAQTLKKTQFAVQHHYAHILSCMAENEIGPPVLGIAWDGTGYGLDKTIWGGEFLKITKSGFERFASFKPFKLPGGEKAIKEPRRSAIGCLYEFFESKELIAFAIKELEFTRMEISNLIRMLDKNINAPVTSSAGRLFDAVASILGIQHYNNYEGQAPMALEFAASKSNTSDVYSFNINLNSEDGFQHWIIDWVPILESILTERQIEHRNKIARKFHNTLLEINLTIAKKCGLNKVVISGGSFQNKLLSEGTIAILKTNGFLPYWHQRVPPNDGGISLGQIMASQYNYKKDN